MQEKKKFYFTGCELALWGASIAAIIISFFVFGGKGVLSLIASIIGATSLIFIAKGNPIGQALTVVFSVLYGIISLKVRYYGEMITYLGMTAPMAIAALISWLRHPYNGNRAEVSVNRLKPTEYAFAFLLTGAITFAFYFMLRAMNTANLIPSTVSVATSFIAIYLTARRSPNAGLRRQRRGAHRAVGNGKRRDRRVRFGHSVLFGIFPKRCLWLHKLAQNNETPA